MKMPPTPKEGGLEEILEKVVEPILKAHESRKPPPEILESALAALDGLDDFEISAKTLLQSERLAAHGPILRSLFSDGDNAAKRGRRLCFDLGGKRSLELAGHAWKGSVEGAFQLEIRLASEAFEEPHVEDKAREDLRSLRAELMGIDPSRILLVAVLPQKKKLLGVHTPLGIEIFGLKFPIRFLIAGFGDTRAKLFAVGPTTRQIA